MESGCLASQEIEERIKDGRIAVEDYDETHAQPSSFEPSLGREGYIIDAEKGLFRPSRDETIKDYLQQLPERHRIPIDISEGYELKRGFTYLFPLNTALKLAEGEYAKSSPKSSIGRVFLHVRLLADYHPNFDEVHAHFSQDRQARLWVLVQPLAFNIIVRPGLALNQLRFFTGSGARLPGEEVRSLGILSYGGKAAEQVITEDGLWLHLKLEGFGALRARRNPIPIDLAKKNEYDPLAYFEPIQARQGAVVIRKGEYYLLSSREVLTIPADLNAELRSHSHVGIQGPLHFAGFIDNGFQGDLVLEVRSDEMTDMVLQDGMPIGVLELFRTGEPGKVYGSEIGSHYQGQQGPRIAKFFKPF